MPLTLRDFGKLLKISFKAWNEKDPFRQSAVIAYYAIFSLPALLVPIISFAGFFFGREAVNQHVMVQISDTMGAETSDQIKELLAKAAVSKSSVWATGIGIIVLFVGATGVF